MNEEPKCDHCKKPLSIVKSLKPVTNIGRRQGSFRSCPSCLKHYHSTDLVKEVKKDV